MNRQNTGIIFCLIFILSFILFTPSAIANSRLATGLTKILTAPFYLPLDVGRGLFHLPFGPVGGALTGTYKTTATLISGVVDLAAGGAPYAKYGLFFI